MVKTKSCVEECFDDCFCDAVSTGGVCWNPEANGA